MNDSTTIPQKRCTKCGEAKPATSEYFNRHKGRRDGLYDQCKSCTSAFYRQYYLAHREKLIAAANQRQKENSDSVREKNRRWQRENPDKLRLYKQRWLKKRPDYNQEYAVVWRNENRSKSRKYTHTYRARKRALPSTFTEAEWHLCLEWWHNVCAYCGAQQSLFHTIQQEHFIPVSKGGQYAASNIIPACKSCNASKQDKQVAGWLVNKFGKRKASAILTRIQAYFDHIKGQSNDIQS